MTCKHKGDHRVLMGADERFYLQCIECKEYMQLPELNYRVPFPADYKPKLTKLHEILKTIL